MKHLSLRLGDDLHARVKSTAEADKRTLNSQVEWLLEAGLHAREHPRGEPIISGRITRITGARDLKRVADLLAQGLVIHHRDGDPTNNDLDNLEIIDPEENRP